MLAIGVRPEQPPHIRERLRLFNATLYTASAVPVVYLVVAVPAFNHPVVWYGVLMAVAGLVGIATGLTLIHLQRFNLGYSLAGIVGWLCGLGLVVTHGSLSGAAILLLSAPGGSILTVGRSFFAKMKFYLTPLLIATVAVVVWGPRHPVVGPPFTEHQLVFLAAFFFVLMFAALSSWNVRTARAIFRLRDQLKVEHAKSEALLLNVLPLPIATRMKAGEQMIADHFDEVTVIFADIVGFTRLAEELTPKALLELLDELFLAFDQLAIEHGLEKIKTVGDGYMAAAGIPVPRVDHVVAAASMAIGMRDAVAHTSRWIGRSLDVRIGMHSGPVVAGVIGKTKLAYDRWGDTVNTAARLESHGLPGEIQVSATIHNVLKDRFDISYRGEVDLKGKGPTRAWLLRGPAVAA
jgi:class 3 adenylate cyclase